MADIKKKLNSEELDNSNLLTSIIHLAKIFTIMGKLEIFLRNFLHLFSQMMTQCDDYTKFLHNLEIN